MNSAEEKVSTFYNTIGWETEGGITEDAKRFEDLRVSASEYVSKCRLRVLRHIPDSGENILDMASGPIQFKEYLEYSRNYGKRYCVDLSSAALDAARKRIGDHGVFLPGSFFDVKFEQNMFDCTISLHTIYHIDKDKQEEAVRKLIAVTKKGRPIIVVYSNPKAWLRYLGFALRASGITSLLRRIKGSLTKKSVVAPDAELYFFDYPITWWYQFKDVADVEIFPWRSFSSNQQKALIPDGTLGKIIFAILFRLEERFPNFFVKHFQYPMIVLKKR
jgi:ubiquinone/menaquinone biosynthesis C-methylase UbiE